MKKTASILLSLILPISSYASNCEETSDLELTFSSTKICTISPGYEDFDTLTFYAQEGDEISIVVSTQEEFAARHEVRSPSGELMQDYHCGWNGCSRVFEPDPLEETGYYTIRLSDYTASEDGDINVRLECRAGPCFQYQQNLLSTHYDPITQVLTIPSVGLVGSEDNTSYNAVLQLTSDTPNLTFEVIQLEEN